MRAHVWLCTMGCSKQAVRVGFDEVAKWYICFELGVFDWKEGGGMAFLTEREVPHIAVHSALSPGSGGICVRKATVISPK